MRFLRALKVTAMSSVFLLGVSGCSVLPDVGDALRTQLVAILGPLATLLRI